MHSAPIEWVDHYMDSRERKIWTEQEHGIPGLRMIGYHNASHAQSPLAEHFHKDCFEFTYVVRGNLHFSAEGESYALSGGDLYLTKPDEVHSTGRFPMSLHQMYWFQLETDDPEHLLYLDPNTARWVIGRLEKLRQHVIKISPAAESLMREVVADIAGGTESGRVQAGLLLGVLLCQILRDTNLHENRTTADIARAVDYIGAHICEDITIEELADASILSVSRFKQKFKAQLGTSPRNYINFHKIELARQALDAGRSVTDTAMELGFSSSDYFAVVFRRYTSLSPTEYARQHRRSPPGEEW